MLAYITIICHSTVVEANVISALVHDTVMIHEMNETTYVDVSGCVIQQIFNLTDLKWIV